ncbi:hypothetical protein XELAEV_180267943mg, partial [Xenopus laevis]
NLTDMPMKGIRQVRRDRPNYSIPRLPALALTRTFIK